MDVQSLHSAAQLSSAEKGNACSEKMNSSLGMAIALNFRLLCAYGPFNYNKFQNSSMISWSRRPHWEFIRYNNENFVSSIDAKNNFSLLDIFSGLTETASWNFEISPSLGLSFLNLLPKRNRKP